MSALGHEDGFDLNVFLKVTHTFTRATHRLGDYLEPSDDEVSKYDSVISSVVREAVADACRSLGGGSDLGTCKLGSIGKAR